MALLGFLSDYSTIWMRILECILKHGIMNAISSSDSNAFRKKRVGRKKISFQVQKMTPNKNV